MDYQMPEMDEYGTTRRICLREQEEVQKSTWRAFVRNGIIGEGRCQNDVKANVYDAE